MVLLGGFMAGVGQVEHILLLLRIEHQRVLVRPLHGFHQPVAHALTLAFVHLYLLRHLTVIRRQFGTQNAQGMRQVFFLQHGVGAHHSKQHHQYG